MKADAIETWLVSKLAETLKTGVAEVERNRSLPFASHGLDSLALLTLTGELAAMLGRDLPVTLVWEYPTIETLARHLAAPGDNAADCFIPRAPRDRPLPLSFAQERIWRYARQDGEGDSNNIVERFILHGALDVGALQDSLSEMIRRHEILRTTFSAVEGRPLQIIHPPAAANLELADLRADPNPADEALRLLGTMALQPMNLERGPLFRTMLLRLAEFEHRLVFVLHHLLYDAASLVVFYEEFSALYAAYSAGAPAPLAEPALQTADFAAWQRDRFSPESEVYQGELDWWKQYWSGPMPRALELPFRRARRPEVPGANHRIDWEVPPTLFDQVMDLGRREGATSYMVFFAAFESLLFQLTGLEDMAIGTYVSDRNRIAAKSAMGIFVNHMPLRARFSGHPTFLEVLHQVRDTLQNASIHQEFPFEELARELHRERREAPWVQVIFHQIQDAKPFLELKGVAIGRWRGGLPARAGWGLTLCIVEAPGKLSVKMDFDDGLYDPAGIAEMLRQYESLVNRIVADPDGRISPFRASNSSGVAAAAIS